MGRPACLGYSVLGVSVRRPVCAFLAWLPIHVGQGAFLCRRGIDLFTGRSRRWAGGIDFPSSGGCFQFSFNHLRRVASESHYKCPCHPCGARGQTRGGTAAGEGGKKMRRHLGRLVDAAWRAPLTANETFGPQVCPQRMPGDFAATSWLHSRPPQGTNRRRVPTCQMHRLAPPPGLIVRNVGGRAHHRVARRAVSK